MFCRSIFLLVSILTSASVGNPIDPGDLIRKEETLVLLHVLFRHGNRSPDKASLFPNDIHLSETYSPFGYSQLTLKGKKTEYAIGKYLRQTYGTFLPTQYTPDTVYALSTNFKRTKMSLELVLASLFPPQTTEIIEQGVNWQPIPYSYEEGDGIIGVAPLYCANYIRSYCNYVKSDEAQLIIDDYRDLYAELEPLAGMEIKTPADIGSLYFTFKSEDDFGLTLPAWAARYYPDVLEEAFSVDYEFSTATPALRRLAAGRLLQKILKDSELKRNGSLPADRKIFLYSAHEYNVATMLRALNVFYRHVPPFGATIFFEIHNINGDYALKLSYQDYKSTVPRVLTIPGCSSYCKLNDLYPLISNNLPTESDVCVATGEL